MIHELFSPSFSYVLKYENFFSDILQASICPIRLEGQLFVNLQLLSCELLVFRNSVKAESVFL